VGVKSTKNRLGLACKRIYYLLTPHHLTIRYLALQDSPPEAGSASDIRLSATVLPIEEFYLIGSFGEFPIK
jgi:hypothetical protein